jgi:succinyl-diaminopimelate desuccinylase
MSSSLITYLTDLIAIDTSRTEIQAMLYIQSCITKLGLPWLTYTRQDIGIDGRYNLIVSNTTNPQIVLAWHVDTVAWTDLSQLQARIVGDQIYGRWAVDMKAGVALIIEMIPRMVRLQKPFWVVFYCDEEYYFQGMKTFVAQYKDIIQPRVTIITEPTDNQIQSQLRGITEFRLTVTSSAQHAAVASPSDNVIRSLIMSMDRFVDILKLRDLASMQTNLNIAEISWGTYQNHEYITQANMSPNRASILCDIRLWSQIDQASFDKILKSSLAEFACTLVDHTTHFRYPVMYQAWCEEKYQNLTGIQTSMWLGYSDIQMIQSNIWWDCLLYGPWPCIQSHRDDEHVSVDSMKLALQDLQKIICTVSW